MTIEIGGRPRAHAIKYAIALALLVPPILVGLYTLMAGTREQKVTLAVAFALTDSGDYPLPGVPVRVAFAGQDWQGADAGQRFTTDAKGEARFTAAATIDKRWQSAASYIPAPPHRADHLLIAVEFERVVPVGGKDTHFHWLLVSHVYCDPNGGACSGGYVDEVYAKGDQGRFDRRLDTNRGASGTDPDTQSVVASGVGYKPSDWLLENDDSDRSGRGRTLRLAYKSLAASPTALLAAAAEAGDVDRVNALLAAGADANGKPAYGPTALLVAARNNHVPVVRALLAAKADIDARADKSGNGYTALIAASERGHLETVQALLAAGADVNAGADAIGLSIGDRGATALFVAADHSHLEVVQALLAAGADANARQYNDFTPLIAARDSPPIVRALLAAGADPNGADKQGHTALGWAKQAGREDVVELLRQHGGHE